MQRVRAACATVASEAIASSIVFCSKKIARSGNGSECDGRAIARRKLRADVDARSLILARYR